MQFFNLTDIQGQNSWLKNLALLFMMLMNSLLQVYSAGENRLMESVLLLLLMRHENTGKSRFHRERRCSDYIINKVKSGDYILTIGAEGYKRYSLRTCGKVKSTFHEEVIGNIPEVN